MRPRSLARRVTCRKVLLSSALLAALLPSWAFAGSCNGGLVPDIGACVDATNYNFWKGLAVLGWNLNRLLLIGAYQLDQWRWWLVQNVFLSVYNAMVSVVGPLVTPIAILAMTLAILGVLLLPLTGRIQTLNIRQILVLTMLTPLLMAQSGPWLIDVEQARTQTITTILSGLTASVPTALFGPQATDTDMLAAEALYPASCGGATLARGGPGGNVLGLDDAAAAVLWANAIDIHCPQQAGSEHPELPTRWTEPKPSGADYAYNGDLGDVEDAHVRAGYIAKIQAGTTRAYLALLPSLLALTQRVVELLFSLGLIVLWLGIPVAFVLAFFQQTYAGLTRLAAGALQVFKVSIVVSVLLDILVVSLVAATALGNGTAYIAFAAAAVLFMIWFVSVALSTLKASLGVLNETVHSASGLSPAQALQSASGAAMAGIGVGAAALTGGASLAMLGMAAQQQSGSGRYAAGAMLGRTPLGTVGEIGAALGYVSDEELLSGLHVGRHSRRGDWGTTRRRMAADARTTDDLGRTFRERAEERALDRQVTRAERPSGLRREVESLGALREGVSNAFDAAGTSVMGVVTGEVRPLHRMGDAMQESWQRVRGRAQGAMHEAGTDIAARSAGGGIGRRVLATAETLDERLSPDRRGQVMVLDATRQIQWKARLGEGELPSHAITVRATEVNRGRALAQGYALQANDDGTITLWNDHAQTAPSTPTKGRRGAVRSPSGANTSDQARAANTEPPSPEVAQAEARVQLLTAGVLIGNVAEARATLDAARTMGATPAASMENPPSSASPQGTRSVSTTAGAEPGPASRSSSSPPSATADAGATPSSSVPSATPGAQASPSSSSLPSSPERDAEVARKLDDLAAKVEATREGVGEVAQRQREAREQSRQDRAADAQVRGSGISAEERRELDDIERATQEQTAVVRREEDDVERAIERQTSSAQSVGRSSTPSSVSTPPGGAQPSVEAVTKELAQTELLLIEMARTEQEFARQQSAADPALAATIQANREALALRQRQALARRDAYREQIARLQQSSAPPTQEGDTRES